MYSKFCGVRTLCIISFLFNGSLDDKFKLEADDSAGSVMMTARGKVSSTMHKAITEDIQATEYLALVSDMLSNLRQLKQRPQLEQYAAIQFAYHLLAKGYIMPHSYQWLGLPGTRKYTQTYRKYIQPKTKTIIFITINIAGDVGLVVRGGTNMP